MRRIGLFLLLVAQVVAQDHPALRNYGRLPLVFESNQGQADPSVKFLARVKGGTLFLTDREAVLAPRGAAPVRMRLVGAGKPQAIHGLEPTGGISNYFIGNDPAKWRTNIPHYGRVEYKSVYAGVDVVYYGNPQTLEYDLVVAPGADARAIQVEYEGVKSLRVDGEGDLVLQTASGELRQKRPRAYQETAAGRVDVEVGYRLKAGRRIGFELARYDARRRLVIDPVVLYSTYLGGNGDDPGNAIAVDASGNAYVTGSTTSTNFPTTLPLQGSYGGSTDVFVTKINALGSGRFYSTYLGGNADDEGLGIAVDNAGNAYVTGFTSSTNFPIANPFQASHGGGTYDVFVTKINSAGSAPVYSTYLGGSGDDFGFGIAADSSGNAYVTGHTASTNFPTTNPIQASNGGITDAFVTKINSNGSGRFYSTYLGGTGDDRGRSIAVDSTGNAYVTGWTSSADFPTTSPMQGAFGGGTDAFVTKINSNGSGRFYSTYLGGSGSEIGFGIAVDGSGNAYVAGRTDSSNFPTTNPLQISNGGATDVFVTKLNAAGSSRVYSTYLGGSGSDLGQGIAVDGAGNAFVTGYTSSTNFPTTSPLQVSNGGSLDAFVTKINAAGSARVYSTYLGGSGDDEGFGIAVDGSGNAYVTGPTGSTNFPTTNPIQGTNGGSTDAFVLSISGNAPVAAFRDTSGGIELTSELSTLLSNSGGSFASDPSAAQNANGDTFVVARDSSNAMWLNVSDARTRLWDGWVSAGGAIQGVPAVAAIGSTAFIVARDAFNAYWTNTFTRGSGFGGWVNRGGAFSIDPTIGAGSGIV
jgi:Beta-propeller repeat